MVFLQMPPECRYRKDHSESTSAMELFSPLAQRSQSRLCHELRPPATVQQPPSGFPNESSSFPPSRPSPATQVRRHAILAQRTVAEGTVSYGEKKSAGGARDYRPRRQLLDERGDFHSSSPGK